MNNPRDKYHVQKGRAKIRRIAWEFTFETWLKVWQDSGHIQERGGKIDQYVMGRNMDKGPYSPSNVMIITKSKNSSDGQENARRNRLSLATA